MKWIGKRCGFDRFSDPPVRNTKQKEQLFSEVMNKTIDLWRKVYDKSSLKETRERIMLFVKLETEGGNCFNPDCRMAWRLVEKENMYHKIKYYTPGCHCFFKCPLCGRSNHYEMESGLLGKRNYICFCGWKLIDDNKNKKYGVRFEKENFDYLNRIRERNNIYFTKFDGSLVIKRERTDY